MTGTSLRFVVLDVTTLTWPRHDAHPCEHGVARGGGRVYDYSHWCLPGVPDTIAQMLQHTILDAV